MKKRRLFPTDAFTLVSPKPKSDVLRILQNRTHIRQSLLLWRCPKNKDFVGTFTANGFRIMSLVRGESFPPLIFGRITQLESECRVAVHMTFTPMAPVFLIVWVSLCLLISGAAAWTVISGQAALSIGIFVPLVMLVFGVVFIYWGFWHGAQKAKEKLSALLGATMISRPKRH